MRIHDEKMFEKENVFGLGQPNSAYAQYFIGNSYLNPLTEMGKCPVFLANVTFEPGCRNNWHIHHAKKGGGQLLHIARRDHAGRCDGVHILRQNRVIRPREVGHEDIAIPFFCRFSGCHAFL